ncbi:MAG: hypothetical protein MJK10_07135 [Pseudomonadales bacterium]|nr:hypothetical protein [Pseudomonadales bacterium]NRA13925.1 hypothetical protein [Oceanospirillaceae bacterium]
MSDNVIDFKSRQQKAAHQRKEAGFKNMQQRFETALPNEKDSKEKLLGLFKKTKNTRTPKKN